MTDLELINSISSTETLVDSETIDIVYEVVVGNMAKYDSEAVANEIYTEWAWEDVLKLLKGEHPGYEIITTSLAEAADELRAMWREQAAYYDPITEKQYNFDGSARF